MNLEDFIAKEPTIWTWVFLGFWLAMLGPFGIVVWGIGNYYCNQKDNDSSC